jgi:hypothetical protein
MDLHGHWVHAHEEDSGDERVFRPASHPLPRSRGRQELELRPGGTFVERHPGPVDVPVESTGSWSLQGDQLTLGDEVWTVADASPDRLTLKRSAG